MKNKKNKELAVCGFAAVKAIEAKNPQIVKRLYFTEDRASSFKSLCKLMAQEKNPYNIVGEEDLEKLSGSNHHQGVVAMIEMPKIQELIPSITNEILHAKENLILLDRIGNANNFGAIVRSAAFFGIKNIVIPTDEAQTTITTSSYRTAQGGMEYVKIYKVNSTASFLAFMKDKMVRFGTDVKSKTPVSQMKELCHKAGNKGALIVLGNEEKGISSAVKANCDYLVTIPSPITLDTFDSLNVAQASSVIFYALTQN
ncbi:MAG: RNA methyltransferase [Treponemataceae bacterium]|nr:RNA methyltransferase [Treponemataceae bacterium]